MAQKPYFCAYHSYLGSIETLNDAERGRLFTACLTYSLRGEEIELRGNEKHLWPAMKWQIDRDKEKYDAYCQKMKANGALGGSAPKNQKKSKWYQMVPEGTIEKEKEKENIRKKQERKKANGTNCFPASPEAFAPQPPPGEPVPSFPSPAFDSFFKRRMETEEDAYEGETEADKRARVLQQLLRHKD